MTGTVGCLPYMDPEMLMHTPYDAQKADVWSLAIMYCCMILGRFPWKVAARSDEAFRLFTTTTTKRPNNDSLHKKRGMGRYPTAPASLQSSQMMAAVVAPCDLEAETTITVSAMDVMLNEAADGIKATTDCLLVEPCRLLSQLPSKTRELIRNMLLLNAQSRPTLEQINNYPWIQRSQFCASQCDSATAHYGPPHDHVLRH